MATPILTIRMPIPLRRGLDREAARSGRSITEIIIDAIQKAGIESVYLDEEILPATVQVPPAFYAYQASCGSVPAALGRSTKHVTIRLDDPGLSAFVDAARQCVADEGHSLGLRKSARATLNMIERADPKE